MAAASLSFSLTCLLARTIGSSLTFSVIRVYLGYYAIMVVRVKRGRSVFRVIMIIRVLTLLDISVIKVLRVVRVIRASASGSFLVWIKGY